MFGRQSHHEPQDLNDNREDIEDEDNECFLCSGSLVVLGTLGNRLHFRCRNCGMEQSRRAQ